MSIESVMSSSVKDAFKGHDVATVDTPGPFLQAHMDKTVRMTDTMVNILSNIDRMIDKYTYREGKKKVLHLKLRKALYGTLRAALLFWKKISQHIQVWEFKIVLMSRAVLINRLMTINAPWCGILATKKIPCG
jgi:hypothetical protein